MCYYTAQRKEKDEVEAYASELELPFESALPNLKATYRAGPKQKHIVFRAGENNYYQLEHALLGLMPPGAKSPPRALYGNAHSDSVTSKYPWKIVLKKKRALGIIDGFFEPEKVAMSKDKAPWPFYEVRGGALFFVAALVTDYVSSDGEVISTVAFVTVDANKILRVHNRMPAILDIKAAHKWVNEQEPPLELLKPYPEKEMEGWRVPDIAKTMKEKPRPEMLDRVSASD